MMHNDPLNLSGPNKMLFEGQIRVRQRTTILPAVHIGASWQMRLNRPCVAAMWPFIKLV